MVTSLGGIMIVQPPRGDIARCQFEALLAHCWLWSIVIYLGILLKVVGDSQWR